MPCKGLCTFTCGHHVTVLVLGLCYYSTIDEASFSTDTGSLWCS